MKAFYHLAPLFIAGSLSCQGALVGLWEFSDAANPGAATIGNDLTLQGPGTTLAVADGVSTGDGAIQIGAGDHFDVAHDIAANGGGAYVNEFTLVLDVFLPSASDGTWRSLLQTNNTNANDGDLFISSGNAIGVAEIGYSTETLAAENWYRIGFSADLGSELETGGSFVTVFTDGAGNSTLVSHLSQGLDGRHSLYPIDNGNIVKLFADESGEDNLLVVSNVAIYDSALSSADMIALGVLGTTIPEPSLMALCGLSLFGFLRRRRLSH